MSDVESAAQAAYPDPTGGVPHPYSTTGKERAAFRAGWVARDVEVAELRAMLAESEWEYGRQSPLSNIVFMPVLREDDEPDWGLVKRRPAGPWGPADTPKEEQ